MTQGLGVLKLPSLGNIINRVHPISLDNRPLYINQKPRIYRESFKNILHN